VLRRAGTDAQIGAEHVRLAAPPPNQQQDSRKLEYLGREDRRSARSNQGRDVRHRRLDEIGLDAEMLAGPFEPVSEVAGRSGDDRRRHLDRLGRAVAAQASATRKLLERLAEPVERPEKRQYGRGHGLLLGFAAAARISGVGHQTGSPA
jgi:hypothetical protein